MMKLPRHQQFIDQFCPASRPGPAASKPAASAWRVNPGARVETVRLADGSEVHVVDDFVQDPDALVALAQSAAARFQAPAGHPYPGPQLELPEAMSAALDDYFQQQFRARLQAGEPLGMLGRFSRVTQAAGTLDARQRICHRDDSGLDAGERVCASVHYLFRDAQLGGTVFFRSLMSEADTRQFMRDANTLAPDAFGDKYGIPPGYMTESNRYFEVIGRVPARWNRAIFYDGGIFHSGDIRAASQAGLAVGLGRLTINAFFKSRRP
jgi:tryptophan halogenase